MGRNRGLVNAIPSEVAYVISLQFPVSLLRLPTDLGQIDVRRRSGAWHYGAMSAVSTVTGRGRRRRRRGGRRRRRSKPVTVRGDAHGLAVSRSTSKPSGSSLY